MDEISFSTGEISVRPLFALNVSSLPGSIR
jgi:hypothetical protein